MPGVSPLSNYASHQQLAMMEIEVGDVEATDAATLRQVLAANPESVDVHLTLSPDTARLVLQLIEAERDGGAVVVPVQSEFTVNEAAVILGISRPQVYKLVDQGELAHRLVGTHRRITAASVAAYRCEHATQPDTMAELARLADKLSQR